MKHEYTVHGPVQVRSGQILRTVDPNLKVQSTETWTWTGFTSDPYSGWVVVVEQDQPLSKMSVLARFRQWLGGGAGKGPTATENERTCSFWHWVVVLEQDQPPSKTSVIAHSRGLVYACHCVVVVFPVYLKWGVS